MPRKPTRQRKGARCHLLLPPLARKQLVCGFGRAAAPRFRPISGACAWTDASMMWDRAVRSSSVRDPRAPTIMKSRWLSGPVSTQRWAARTDLSFHTVPRALPLPQPTSLPACSPRIVPCSFSVLRSFPVISFVLLFLLHPAVLFCVNTFLNFCWVSFYMLHLLLKVSF